MVVWVDDFCPLTTTGSCSVGRRWGADRFLGTCRFCAFLAPPQWARAGLIQERAPILFTHEDLTAYDGDIPPEDDTLYREQSTPLDQYCDCGERGQHGSFNLG